METHREAAAADLSPPTFSQVVFIDIPHAYSPSDPITCRFTLTTAFQPSSRDWVGIFKVGWSTTKEYSTFVWVETSQDAVGHGMMTRQVVFKDYYLPKDEVEFYQFCYIDSCGQVRGASTPFCFRNPAEQNPESITNDELLVIITQDQVDQSQREKAEMQTELELMRKENETLRNTLHKEQKENASLKEQDEQREAEMTKLIRGKDESKEHNDKLKHMLQLQLKENDRLKEEIVIKEIKQMEIQQSLSEQEKLSQSLMSSKTNEEKYERAAMKINQLKDEREELRRKVEAQSDEQTKLKAKLVEGERELSLANDRFQLLQVDFMSSNKEKEKLAAELQRLQSLACSVDEVKRENQELSRRLSQQEMLSPSPQDDLKNLASKLQETQAKLAAEKEETRRFRRQSEFFESELEGVRRQLATVATTCNEEVQKNSKFEMQFREMGEMMADKSILIEDMERQILLVTHDKNELANENQKLKGDIERLRTVYTGRETAAAAAAAADSLYLQPDDVIAPIRDTSANQDQQSTKGNQENIYETIDTVQLPGEEPPVLVCRHCHEKFPGITEDELEQHEQSHRVCPFCTMICDYMEQSVFEDHVYGHEL